jgi:hypothetical protein
MSDITDLTSAVNTLTAETTELLQAYIEAKENLDTNVTLATESATSAESSASTATEKATSAAASATTAAASASLASQISGLDDVAGALALSSPANIDWLVDLPLKSGKLTNCLSGALTVSRATTAYTINNTGKLTAIAANAAATSKRGIDIFDSVTTLQTMDSSLATNPTVASGCTFVSSSELAPDGSTYWKKIVANSGETGLFVVTPNPVLVSGTYITTSVFVRKSTGNVVISHHYKASLLGASGTKITFDSNTGVAVSSGGTDGVATVQDFGSFYRIALTTQYLDSNSTTPASASCQIRTYGVGETSAEIWGVNATNTYHLAPYIPTTTAAATRASDFMSFPVNDNFPAAGQPFTILMDVWLHSSMAGALGYPNLFGFGTANARLYMFITNSIIYFGRCLNSVAGSLQLGSYSSKAGKKVRIIVSFDGSNLISGVNGVTTNHGVDYSSINYDTTGTFYIGSNHSGAAALNSQFSAFKIANFALTEDQIKALGAA